MRFSAFFIVLVLIAAGATARAEAITWVTSAQPVAQFVETQDSGQLTFLISHLTSFTHHIVHVSPARAYNELEHGAGVCKVDALVTPERQRFARFSARRMVLPGYRLVARKDRLAALAPAIVKGEIDLGKLVSLRGATGGYTHLRHYDAVIADFIQARDGSALTNVIATGLLFNMMQNGRLDYAFVLPMDVYFYSDTAFREMLTMLPIKGADAVAEAGVACSSDQSGKELIHAVDLLLADDGLWAEFVEPLRKWVPPDSYPALLAGRSSNMDRTP